VIFKKGNSILPVQAYVRTTGRQQGICHLLTMKGFAIFLLLKTARKNKMN
jgi:hypothetical protein